MKRADFNNPLSINYSMMNPLQPMNLGLMPSVDEPSIPPDQTGVWRVCCKQKERKEEF